MVLYCFIGSHIFKVILHLKHYCLIFISHPKYEFSFHKHKVDTSFCAVKKKVEYSKCISEHFSLIFKSLTSVH